MRKLVVVAIIGIGVALFVSCAADRPGARDAGISEAEGVYGTIAPFNSYGHVYDANSMEAMRPRVMGTHGVVASGHYLATMAGIDALKAGGNAFDAGVTAAMALKVMKMSVGPANGRITPSSPVALSRLRCSPAN